MATRSSLASRISFRIVTPPSWGILSSTALDLFGKSGQQTLDVLVHRVGRVPLEVVGESVPGFSINHRWAIARGVSVGKLHGVLDVSRSRSVLPRGEN